MIYRKRIWFLISAQNLVPHGGVGTFFSGFASLCKKHNIKLDVIVDEEPRDVAEEMLANHQEVSIYFPENKIQSDHSKWCAFSSERTDLSRVMHFQLAMQKVFQLNLPDIIVSNTPESNFACQAMGLPTLFPTVFYTHLDHSVHWEMDHGLVPFHESLTDWLQKSLLYKHVIAGTQTQKNQISLQNRNVNALELPLACEPELWNSKYQNHPNPEGVLFIGRFEPRKNPQAFVRLIQATNLPAKVLTNRTGYRKWIEAFAEANITDYQVKHSLTGAPKLEFISSAKVAYLPSKLESFGYAALEALHFMPTVLLTKYNWWQNFSDYGVIAVDEKDAAETVLQLYNRTEKYYPQVLDYHKNCEDRWIKFISTAKSTKGTNGQAKIYKAVETNQVVNYSHFFLKDLKREQIIYTDIEGAVATKNHFYCFHKNQYSYLCKSETPDVEKFDQENKSAAEDSIDILWRSLT